MAGTNHCEERIPTPRSSAVKRARKTSGCTMLKTPEKIRLRSKGCGCRLKTVMTVGFRRRGR